MPGTIQEPSPDGLTVKELHPTFGAEIEGVDFENLSDAQFAEIKAALAKVRSHQPTHILGFSPWSNFSPKLVFMAHYWQLFISMERGRW
jgi:hypothetical protein